METLSDKILLVNIEQDKPGLMKEFIEVKNVKKFIRLVQVMIYQRGKFRPQEEQNTLTAILGEIDKLAGDKLI